MIPYERTRQQTIPNSAVKIIGVGGAGANMLDRIALDGMEGAELLACNTDVRTLTSSVAPEKIQLGRNLTKGLGAGGDPELGKQAALEAELEIRDALRDRKIIFICVGLGGGTGSGAAPLIARLGREAGAFTVVFATTPFTFEGTRRREQAEAALNELSVLANALITFDNTRMGELVLAKQGVHEAFSAADRMVSESIRAVTRIVMRPGLVNIGLDDLMAALSSPKSRCLFGSGIAKGENRAQKALKNALVSPLLDRGSLLHDTDTVLVHVCGGEDLTLYELELLMRGLSKHVPDTAQILFGTAVDPAMADSLSVTLVSSLPEDRLRAGLSSEKEGSPPNLADLDDKPGSGESAPGGDAGKSESKGEGEGEGEGAPAEPAKSKASLAVAPAQSEAAVAAPAPKATEATKPAPPAPKAVAVIERDPASKAAQPPAPKAEQRPASAPSPVTPAKEAKPMSEAVAEPEPAPTPAPKLPPLTRQSKGKPKVKLRKVKPPVADASAPAREEKATADGGISDDRPVKLPPISEHSLADTATHVKLPSRKPERPVLEDVFESAKGTDLDVDGEAPPSGPRLDGSVPALTEVSSGADDESERDVVASFETIEPSEGLAPAEIQSLDEIQASAKKKRPQGELALDGGPKGKFEGEDPNLLEGEDLDIPPFLRKQKGL